MSLDQVRTLVDASADGRRDALREHLVELDRRQAELERSRHLTQHALECRAHDITTCPGFQAHVEDIVEGAGAACRCSPNILENAGDVRPPS